MTTAHLKTSHRRPLPASMRRLESSTKDRITDS